MQRRSCQGLKLSKYLDLWGQCRSGSIPSLPPSSVALLRQEPPLCPFSSQGAVFSGVPMGSLDNICVTFTQRTPHSYPIPFVLLGMYSH